MSNTRKSNSVPRSSSTDSGSPDRFVVENKGKDSPAAPKNKQNVPPSTGGHQQRKQYSAEDFSIEQRERTKSHIVRESIEILSWLPKQNTTSDNISNVVLFYPKKLFTTMDFVRKQIGTISNGYCLEHFMYQNMLPTSLLNDKLKNSTVIIPICYGAKNPKNILTGESLEQVINAYIAAEVAKIHIYLGEHNNIEISLEESKTEEMNKKAAWLSINEKIKSKYPNKIEIIERDTWINNQFYKDAEKLLDDAMSTDLKIKSEIDSTIKHDIDSYANDFLTVAGRNKKTQEKKVKKEKKIQLNAEKVSVDQLVEKQPERQRPRERQNERQGSSTANILLQTFCPAPAFPSVTNVTKENKIVELHNKFMNDSVTKEVNPQNLAKLAQFHALTLTFIVGISENQVNNKMFNDFENEKQEVKQYKIEGL